MSFLTIRRSEVSEICKSLDRRPTVFFRTAHVVFLDSRNVCCSSHCTDAHSRLSFAERFLEVTHNDMWYGEYGTLWLSVAVTYRKWFSGHNLWTISNMYSFISTLHFL
jgi:hypothetical protein